MDNKSRHIILTARPMVWMLKFTYEDIYAIVSTQTAYDDNRSNEVDGTRHIVMDDDRPLFNYYLSIAISDLTGLLARRIDPQLKITLQDGTAINNNGVQESSQDITYHLVMDENHEEHLVSSLHRYCTDFLVKRVLEQWYHRGNLAADAKASIIRVLEFRRRPVRRPIRNFL